MLFTPQKLLNHVMIILLRATKIFSFFILHKFFFSSLPIAFCAICLLFFVCDFLHSILNCVNVYSFNFVDERKKKTERERESEREAAHKKNCQRSIDAMNLKTLCIYMCEVFGVCTIHCVIYIYMLKTNVCISIRLSENMLKVDLTDANVV